MQLADVQAAVGPRYSEFLSWRQDGSIVKAYPRWPLSEAAFKAIKKAFKRLGGKFVSRQGRAWFELVLQEYGVRQNTSYTSLNAIEKVATPLASSPAPDSVLNQIQAQLVKLAEAGRQLSQA